jgi:MFS family permease
VIPGRAPGVLQAVILLAASGLTTLVTAILGPTLPQMQEHFAAVSGARYWVPLAVTAPLVVMALSCVFVGAAADRLGRRRLLIWGTVLYSLVGTAPLWLHSLQSIIASRLIVGLADATVMTCSLTMIGDYWSGTLRQRVLALQTTVGSASAVLFSLIGGALGHTLGWRAPFAVYGAALLLALLMKRYLWEPNLAAGAAAAAGVRVDAAGIFKPKLLAGISALAIIGGVVFLIVPLNLGFLLQAIGVASPADIGIAQALNSAGVVAGTLAFGWLAGSRLRVPGQMVLSAGTTGIGLLCLAWSGTYVQVILSVTLEGIGCGLLLPMLVTWNMRELPAARRGVGNGAFTSCLFFGMFLSPVAVLFAADQLRGRPAALMAIGVSLLVAAVIASGPAMRRQHPIVAST